MITCDGLNRRIQKVVGGGSADFRNRLTKVQTYHGSDAGAVFQTVTYGYDAFDHRISKTISGNVTLAERYVYDGANLVAVVDAGTLQGRQVYLQGLGQNQVLAQDTVGTGGTTTVWALTDHEGSVRDVVNGSGGWVGHVIYSSFGAVSPSSTYYAFRMGYTGQVYDAETGLDYYNARYYDPGLGKFISADPMGFAAGDGNLCRYVGNDPMNAVDPTGMTEASDASDSMYKQYGGPNNGPLTEVQMVQFYRDHPNASVPDADRGLAEQAANLGKSEEVNWNKIPAKRVDDLVKDKLAIRYSKDGNYVFVADVVDNSIKYLLLHRGDDVCPRTGKLLSADYRLVDIVAPQTHVYPGSIPGILAGIRADADTKLIPAFLHDAQQKERAGIANRNVAILTAVTYALPGAGTAERFRERPWSGEFWLSFAGDAAMLLSLGLPKIVAVTRGVAGAINAVSGAEVSAASVASAMRLSGAGIQGAIGVTRAVQGGMAIKDGEYGKATGYIGEAILRLLGMSAAVFQELQAAQSAGTEVANAAKETTAVSTAATELPPGTVQTGPNTYRLTIEVPDPVPGGRGLGAYDPPPVNPGAGRGLGPLDPGPQVPPRSWPPWLSDN